MTEEQKVRRAIKKVKPIEVEKEQKSVMIKEASVSTRPRKGAQIFMTGEYHISASVVANRGTWYVSMRIPMPPDGKVKQVMRSTGIKVQRKADGSIQKNRKAEQLKEVFVQDIKKELLEAQKANFPQSDATVEDYINRFLTQKAKEIERTTLESYTGYAKSIVIPALGKIKMQDLTPAILQDFFEGIKAEHTVKSLSKYRVVLNGAIDAAYKDGIIALSPMHGVKLPKKDSTFTGDWYTADEAKQAIRLLDKEDFSLTPAVMLALHTGMRRGEICGLRWIDVDFLKEEIHIRHTVKQNGGLVYEKDHTKTKSSTRVIPIIPELSAYLQELLERQKQCGFPIDKVCTTKKGETLQPDYLTRRWNKFVKQHGLRPVRLHDLRHTAASLMLMNGTDVKVLAEILGHKDVAVTLNTYSHVASEQKRNALITLGALCGR